MMGGDERGSAPRSIRMTVAYDGTDFAGFQDQAGQRTVQGALEVALQQITGAPTRIQGAGRTDAGVHAIGQVVSFTTTCPMMPHRLRGALNGVLPDDVAIIEVRDAPTGFHARYDATGRGYRYSIWNASEPLVLGRQYAFLWRRHLDLDRMNTAAGVLIGRHDFAAFGGSLRGRERATSTVRNLFRLRCWREGARVSIEAVANAFLPRMMRNLVGTLLQVGVGQATAEDVRAILASRTRHRNAVTAPALGLCLTKVWYD